MDLLEMVLLTTLVLSTALYVSRVILRATAQWQDRAAVGAGFASLPADRVDGADGRVNAGAGVTTAPARAGDPIGMVSIPRLRVEASVREGVDEKTLSLAVGRIPGTSTTPREGNMALAAHRDTHFRPLRNIRMQDRIRLRTAEGSFDYTVTDMRVVDPEDVWVLDPTPRATLTLVTCYPFNYVGPAPQRFIVRAERVAGTAPSRPR